MMGGSRPGGEDRFVRIEETFDATRARVFDAWVRPELLAQWFAPAGCALHIVRMDVRPGGTYHWCVRHPVAGDCWTIGTYVEVTPPERLVFTSVIADAHGHRQPPASQGHDPAWPQETVITVTFEERAARTVVTLTQDVSVELARRTGAHPSWLEMLQHLHRYVRSVS